MKYGQHYICKRLRMLSYLRERGFEAIGTMPDIENPNYNVWIFDNSPELEQAIDGYFRALKAKNKQYSE